MSRSIDLLGQRFGRLEVLSRASIAGNARWQCACECGSRVTVYAYNLQRGLTRSCGCYSRDKLTKHGHTKRYSATYVAWQHLSQRCENPKCKHFNRYGGRGICISERWKDFRNFLHDMGERPSPLHSLDRIDNNGNYEPSNCRWATKKQQQRNMHNNRIIEFNREKLCLSAWAERLGIKVSTLAARIIDYGWSIDRAFSAPVNLKYSHTEWRNSRPKSHATGLAHIGNKQRKVGAA